MCQVNKLSVKTSARGLALTALMRVFKQQSYSNISLNHVLADQQLTPADRNLATQIFYGTIQRKLFLEYQLKGLVRTKLREPYLEPLLLMSIYQLVFLDKIPDRAVLDEANKLAKAFGRPKSSGFRLVNGILRAFIRRQTQLPKDDLAKLSVQESFPQWLVSYFIKNWGLKRTEQMLASLNQPAKNSTRISGLAKFDSVWQSLVQSGFSPARSALNPQAAILAKGGISNTPMFKEGQLTIQDEAAGLVVEAFDFAGDERVLDACSAPGGKTVQIAEHLTKGKVTALDIHAKKLALVEQNAKRMGVADKVAVKACDARQAGTFFSDQSFAKILVDAPCSGLGLLRRKPEIRYTKQLADLRNLQRIQLQILDQVSFLLKPTGELVYSTCSISVEENEEVIDQFLKTHADFELVPFTAGNLTSDSGMLKILPDTYGSDGFFIAKLRLRG